MKHPIEIKPVSLVCALLLAALALPAPAQTFPNRTLRILVTVTPGGAPSLTANLLAEQMGPALGQSVIVEHKPGGNGIPAVLDVMNAPADGHTLISLTNDQWGVGPALSAEELPYDTLRDLAPIGTVYRSTQVIVVNSSVPARDLKELIALARAKPGMQYGFGSNVHQLIMESFRAGVGIDIQSIPYKGTSQAITALLAGDIPIACSGLNNVMAAVQAGKLRILASTGATRTPQNPEIPTVTEAAGLPGFSFVGQVGLFTRAGVPKPAIDKLVAAYRRAVSNPDVIARAFKGGASIDPSTPEELAEAVRGDAGRYVQAVKAAGLTPKRK